MCDEQTEPIRLEYLINSPRCRTCKTIVKCYVVCTFTPRPQIGLLERVRQPGTRSRLSLLTHDAVTRHKTPPQDHVVVCRDNPTLELFKSKRFSNFNFNKFTSLLFTCLHCRFDLFDLLIMFFF